VVSANSDAVLRTALLSPHLSLHEFLGSNGHPDLVPLNVSTYLANPEIRANALRLARDVFEPVRAIVGPLRVSSGFRCDMLNRAVGGAGYRPGQKPSAHMDGRAMDVEPLHMSLVKAMELLIASGVPFEKIIYERGQWIHLQVGKPLEKLSHLAFMWFGGAAYPPFDALDARVREAA
jgi:zinc D-Ala-D-Ala carboxypeptidase